MTPAYVSRETGAALLDISVDTWDAMVKGGRLPKPVRIGISGTTPRWRWADIDEALSGKRDLNADNEPEPFFRGLAGGKTKDRRRVTS
jgi:predicted DNA-binding transcriptional regulator AlpA